MQTYRVKITQQAQEQMIDIADYIQNELLAPRAAIDTMSALRSSIKSLSSMPGRIQLTEEEPWHSEGIRRMVVQNFYVYFWIDEDRKIIQVMAVVYARRDQMRFLQSLSRE